MGSASTVPTPWGEVSSLNCVYLLAPCRENLPINSVLILLGCNPTIFLIHKQMNFAPPHVGLPPNLLLPCCSVPSSHQSQVSESRVHARNRQTPQFGFSDIRGAATADGPKKTTVMENLPAVLGIHLLFHSRQDLRAGRHSASRRRPAEMERFGGEEEK